MNTYIATVTSDAWEGNTVLVEAEDKADALRKAKADLDATCTNTSGATFEITLVTFDSDGICGIGNVAY
jgi:hypothetical protein